MGFLTAKLYFSLIVCCVFCFLSCTVNAADVGGNTVLKVYYIDWFAQTKGRLSPDALKSRKEIYIEVTDYSLISALDKKLRNLKCTDLAGKEMVDIRLVIDFIDHDKVIKSIYASNRRTYMDGKVCDVDKEFYGILNVF